MLTADDTCINVQPLVNAQEFRYLATRQVAGPGQRAGLGVCGQLPQLVRQPGGEIWLRRRATEVLSSGSCRRYLGWLRTVLPLRVRSLRLGKARASISLITATLIAVAITHNAYQLTRNGIATSY